MANNTTLPAGSGGDTIRNIDKAGVKTQVIAIDLGGAGAESLLTGTMPVSLAILPGVLDVTATGSLAALNATAALTITAGYSAAVVQITGTWVGTITFEGTADGTNWVSINAIMAGSSTPSSTTTTNGIARLSPAGMTQIRANMSAYTSGTATITLRASQGGGVTFLNQSLPVGSSIIGKVGIDQTTPGTTNLVSIGTNGTVAIGTALPTGANTIGTVNAPTLTKGTQGATGFTTQDLKDAGRVLFSAATVIAGVAAVTVEALVSMVPTRAGVAGAGATSFAVTAGKTVRLTALNVGFVSTAIAVLSMRFALRFNPSGAATATSPILLILPVDNGAALAQTGGWSNIALPDGLEFSGTHQFGITQIGSAATGTVWISLVGFEY